MVKNLNFPHRYRSYMQHIQMSTIKHHLKYCSTLRENVLAVFFTTKMRRSHFFITFVQHDFYVRMRLERGAAAWRQVSQKQDGCNDLITETCIYKPKNINPYASIKTIQKTTVHI